MYDGLERNGWQANKIRDWLLAIVRFAITLEQADRQTVLDIALEMDGLGFLPGRSSFSYFLRTSTEVCRAIADRDDPDRTAILRRHVGAIDDRRLRQVCNRCSINVNKHFIIVWYRIFIFNNF